MAGQPRARLLPYAVAVAVTLLWSSSYVLIKWGLQDLPPVYFATLRYLLAFAVLALADVMLRKRGRGVQSRSPLPVRKLIVAGVFGYTVAQGFQYVGLFFLPAITTSLILTFNPIFVLILGVAMIGERAGRKELGGLAIALVGALVFFYSRVAWQGEWLGLAFTVSSGAGWAVYVILIRGLHIDGRLDSLRLTSVTMGVGAAGMVALTALTGEYAPLNLEGIAIVLWLATANTALAFFLWNWSLASIPPYHLTVLQNVMLVEIALFSLAFLGEVVTPLMVAGMGLVLVGVVIVQLRSFPSAGAGPARALSRDSDQPG